MQIALLHLSDIHVRADRKNVVFDDETTSDRIVDAVQSRLTNHSIDASFLVVTGDIAFQGIHKEYELSKNILAKIVDGLKDTSPSIPLFIVMVPGNHDCDFATKRPEAEARTRILATEKLDTISEFEVDIMTCVQEPYWLFATSLMGTTDNRRVTALSPCVQLHDFTFGSSKFIRFYLLNTAWMSQKSEKQGHLVFPTDGLREPDDAEKPELSVVLQHHPKTWFRSTNSRDLGRRLERIADLVLTGHEHESDDADVTRASGAQLTYIEGFALQTESSSGGPSSAFKVLVVDTTAGNQTTYDLVRGLDGVYVPSVSAPPSRPLGRNPLRLDGTYPWSERGAEFASELNRIAQFQIQTVVDG